nr:MAG TPA: hypothetical protein [Caudoviricetes sp.]
MILEFLVLELLVIPSQLEYYQNQYFHLDSVNFSIDSIHILLQKLYSQL